MTHIQKSIIYDDQTKLRLLQQQGIDPYPEYVRELERTPINEIIEDHGIFKNRLQQGDNDQYYYTLAGRIIARRHHGDVIFFDIEDEAECGYDGRIQVMVKREVAPKTYELAAWLDVGDIVRVTGCFYVPPREERTIHAKDMQLLSKTLQALPDKKEYAKGVTDAETRYRRRELDLLGNAHVREIFRKRCRIVQAIRAYLDLEGFLELETPILQPLPGGSDSRPFKTHYHSLKRDMVLSLSPEMYINRAIIGGFERVYALTRSFRNEGISRKHNPEFTELEFMYAFADLKDLARLVENLIGKVSPNTIKIKNHTVNMRAPWQKYTLDELLRKHSYIARSYDPELIMDFYTHKIEPTLIEPTLVFDFPIEAFPLCRQYRDRPHLAEHFDGVIGGIEVISADMELNDPVDQARRFEQQAVESGKDGTASHDAEYIKALECGMPPTAGAAIGIDRLVMLLTEQTSIREAIPFPMLKSI